MNAISPGLLYSHEDVLKIFTDNGYTTPPNSIGRVNCMGGPLTVNNIVNTNFQYFCSYFFRENDSSFQTTNPQTVGAAMPYFFGQSKLHITVSAASGDVGIVVNEVCFARYFNDGTADDGTETIRHLIGGNAYKDFVEGDLITIESKGNTRYWDITLYSFAAGATLSVSLDSFWSGIGGVDRYIR